MSGEDRTPERVLLFECNLDDMTGEALGFALERLLEAGALEAWYTPIYMKKNRPAVLLSVLCREEDGDAMGDLLLQETTTLGVRRRVVERVIAQRAQITVEMPWGPVACKLKRLHGRVVSLKPEYDDCARIAREQGLALSRVADAARAAAWRMLGDG